MLYERLVRPRLFRMAGGDAESAHEWTLRQLARHSGRFGVLRPLTRPRRTHAERLARTVFGIRFPNPVGLAAGMDKNAVALDAWPLLGFGFIELGTVTWHPQPGNPRPRVFRAPVSEGIVNRMGFNNDGARAVAERLASHGRLPVPVGLSLGKSKVTPVESAVDDYLDSLRVLYPYADYFAVNVSSPNTPGLRSLQNRSALTELLGALVAEAEALTYGHRPRTPLLVKIAPDLGEGAIGDVLEVCADLGVDGIVATNTTLDRAGVAIADVDVAGQVGGLSGRPLTARALEVVRFVSRETGGRLPIVGVGGLLDPDDALRMIDAGASLVQLYTGLIYRGPGLVRQVNRALATR